MAADSAVDLHQHLWPASLVDRLRARTRAPYLRGWTLHTLGEAPYEVEPEHHDVAARIAQDQTDGVALACVSLSAPLGIESLARPEAATLLAAWHAGARTLPAHYRA
ncbi:MAG: amidohydrolase, partial [Nocardioidaceae bacterium]